MALIFLGCITITLTAVAFCYADSLATGRLSLQLACFFYCLLTVVAWVVFVKLLLIAVPQ